MTPTSTPPAKRENLVLNLVCNVALPTVILTKLSAESRLGPVWSLIVALSFPTAYGIFDFVRRRKTNLISVLGFVSVLLTGGLGLMKAERSWFAVKEASVPLIIGIMVVSTSRSKRSLVRELFFNDQVLNVERINGAFTHKGSIGELNTIFAKTSWLIGGSMLLSAVLNYVLAVYFLKSPPGTAEFTAELGHMNAVSYPVIMLPSMAVMIFALWQLLHSIERKTGLTLEEVLREHPAAEPLSKVLFSCVGRVGREAFWTLLLIVGCLAILAFDAFATGTRVKALLTGLATVLALWAFFVIQIKRWHDRDRSGVMLAIHLIPGIGSLWTLIELGILPGSAGSNRFGNRLTPDEPRSAIEPATTTGSGT